MTETMEIALRRKPVSKELLLPARQLISVYEAADMLGLSPWTMRAHAYKGRISSHKIGTRLLFDRAEIERVIAESERPRLRETK
jgi:excisionase family DNA binding protein